MSDDLETQPPDGLGAPTADPATGRAAARAGIGALAVIAIAVAVAVASVVIFGHGGSVPAAGGGEVLAGSRWVLDSVRADGHDVAVPSEPQYVLSFGSDTEITLDDSVNFMSGRYTRTASGFTTTDVATTLVAYGGDDPTRLMTIAAMDAVALRENADTNTVDVQLHGDGLVVTAGKYQLTFIRAGTAAPVPAASGTPPIGDEPTSSDPSGAEPGSGTTSPGFSGQVVVGAH